MIAYLIETFTNMDPRMQVAVVGLIAAQVTIYIALKILD